MHTCTGKKETYSSVRRLQLPRTKFSSILSWHCPLLAQGRLAVMQDLAGHEPSA